MKSLAKAWKTRIETRQMLEINIKFSTTRRIMKEYIYGYERDLGISSITLIDRPGMKPIDGMRVLAIVNQPGVKRAAITAYLAARYSRLNIMKEGGPQTVVDIAKEVDAGAIDAPERLAVIHGYGQHGPTLE